VEVGDHLYALPASGFHSNGYSLLRHWLKDRAVDAATLTQLMEPTRIYHEVPELLDRVGPEALHALANITGGGISGNLPRVLPAGTRAAIDFASLPTPAWMRAFLGANGTTPRAQEGVFNLGAGMIAAVAVARAGEVVTAARELGLELTRIGEVTSGTGEATVTFS
jgi:phosphoribosylformylglycinamidine cyclo-ligase